MKKLEGFQVGLPVITSKPAPCNMSHIACRRERFISFCYSSRCSLFPALLSHTPSDQSVSCLPLYSRGSAIFAGINQCRTHFGKAGSPDMSSAANRGAGTCVNSPFPSNWRWMHFQYYSQRGHLCWFKALLWNVWPVWVIELLHMKRFRAPQVRIVHICVLHLLPRVARRQFIL